MKWTKTSVVVGLIAVAAGTAWVVWVRSGTKGPPGGGDDVWKTDPVASYGTPIPPEIADALSEVANLKAAALENATIQVHRAYLYRGPTDLAISETGKLIAVEIGVGGYTQHFKIWDIDIIDGETIDNFGSDPDVAFLDPQGRFIAFDGDQIDSTKPLRLLLVYGVPLKTKTIKLGYWGKELTTNPIPLQPSGPSLPKRP